MAEAVPHGPPPALAREQKRALFSAPRDWGFPWPACNLPCPTSHFSGLHCQAWCIDTIVQNSCFQKKCFKMIMKYYPSEQKAEQVRWFSLTRHKCGALSASWLLSSLSSPCSIPGIIPLTLAAAGKKPTPLLLPSLPL